MGRTKSAAVGHLGGDAWGEGEEPGEEEGEYVWRPVGGQSGGDRGESCGEEQPSAEGPGPEASGDRGESCGEGHRPKPFPKKTYVSKNVPKAMELAAEAVLGTPESQPWRHREFEAVARAAGTLYDASRARVSSD